MVDAIFILAEGLVQSYLGWGGNRALSPQHEVDLDFVAEGKALERLKGIDLALIFYLKFRKQLRPANIYPALEVDSQVIDFNLIDEAFTWCKGYLLA
jgi:hypothetical protein